MPKSPSITSLLSPSTTLLSTNRLTTLWAGYGSIYRLRVQLPGTSTPTSVILKVITPPTSASDDDTGTPDEGHIRKLISYSAESWFYHNLSDRLEATYSDSNLRAPKVAKLYRDILAGTPGASAYSSVLPLEDLAIEFPFTASHVTSESHVQAVIRWLAHFHAAFFNCGADSDDSAIRIPGIPPPLLARPNADEGGYAGIWAQGGYWYLATRRSENEDMLSSGEWTWLEPWVEYVDQRLWPKGRLGDGDVDPASFLGRTVLHGDTKSANILFSKPIGGKSDPTNQVEAALYDFQYVGHGLGVVDLVYFLGTSARLKSNVEDWQRYYYDEVVSALKERVQNGAGEWTWEVFLKQFDWAVVDWCRFGAGWGGWGNWRWVVGRAHEIVDKWEENQGQRD